jgi:hypothetical protein
MECALWRRLMRIVSASGQERRKRAADRAPGFRLSSTEAAFEGRRERCGCTRRAVRLDFRTWSRWASMAGRALGPRARRVVIKSRFVVLKKAGGKAVATHYATSLTTR